VAAAEERGVTQLQQLARPVPSKYVKTLQGRGNPEYVAHSTITEILLMVCGPFDFHVTEVVRDQDQKITGCLATLTVDVDGRRTSITEVGDTTGVETDEGGALKNAASDALKRCAMRLGVALHLWARDGYFLYEQLTKSAGGGLSTDGPVSAGTEQSSATGPAATRSSDGGGVAPPVSAEASSLASTSAATSDPCQECGRAETSHAPSCSRRPFPQDNKRNGEQ